MELGSIGEQRSRPLSPGSISVEQSDVGTLPAMRNRKPKMSVSEELREGGFLPPKGDSMDRCRRLTIENLIADTRQACGCDVDCEGDEYIMDKLDLDSYNAKDKDADAHKIGELPSTAICGNDITASCFYVVGELSKNAGVYSPICTLLSSFTLFCFRSVYSEVVMALPLNGGIYNLLLNSSSKRSASVAACLTILSYTATGVVSSVSAADYLKCSPMFSGIESVPTSIGILWFFAVLMLFGMQESSAVAAALFVFHLSTLFILATMSVLFLQEVGLGQLYANMEWEKQPSMAYSIFFGFSSAMLGVSGFETSANFVEEQKEGVFPKTLTNMWVSVSCINVVLPSLSIAILPLDDLTGERSAYALAFLGERVGGPLLRDLVAIDALLVLAGSVLTSYVGVCGLFQRMAGDRCLPDFFSQLNSWRNTPHWTILVFFIVCSSMCILLDGDITLLAAIYSISFLLVMGLFAFCGLWMKMTRPTLYRSHPADPIWFVLGLLLVGTAFTAVVLLHPEMLTYFYIYYGITVLIVMTTFARVPMWTAFLQLVDSSKLVENAFKVLGNTSPQQWVDDQLKELQKKRAVVYFIKHADFSQINRALQYIEENEETRVVRVIHCCAKEGDAPDYLYEYVQLLDCVYPKIKVDCIVALGEFGPAMVREISKQLDVPINCMFINCPKRKLELDKFGGVRVILNSDKRTIAEHTLQNLQEVHHNSQLRRESKTFRGNPQKFDEESSQRLLPDRDRFRSEPASRS